MASIFNTLRVQLGVGNHKRSPEEIQAEINSIKEKIKQEKKAIEDCSILVTMYQRANDAKGLDMTQQTIRQIEKNIQQLKIRKKHLKEVVPPRPLPQPNLATSQFIGRVLWDFDARGEGELSVKANALVNILQQFGESESDTDWWRVEEWDSKQVGYIPASYCQIVANQGKSINTTAKQSERTLIPIQPEKPDTSKTEDTKVLFTAVALYDYTATKEDELSFHYNDRVEVLSKEFPGWWKGRVIQTVKSNEDNEKPNHVGLFPSNYVQDENQLSDNILAATNESTDEFKIFYAETLYEYTATYKDELGFKRGQIIKITAPQQDGWFYGTIDGKNSGFVPSNYIKEVSEEVVKARRTQRKLPTPPGKPKVQQQQQQQQQPQQPIISPQNGDRTSISQAPSIMRESNSETEPLLANSDRSSRECCCIII